MIRIENLVAKRGDFVLNVPELVLYGRNSFIFGRNGSGKTTLLMTIAGLIPYKGKIMKDNTDITYLPPEKRDITLIPQDLSLFPNMNVWKNITVSIRHSKGNDQILDELIDTLGIRKLLPRKVWELSLGEAQRVAVARALVSSPSIILMDEPFSMQDEISRLNSLSLLDDLSNKYKFEYVYVTHNPKDLDLGFSTLVTLDEGGVVESVSSIRDIKHYRTLALLDYSRIIKINGNYFKINENNIRFSDDDGYTFNDYERNGTKLLKISIDGEYAFINYRGDIKGSRIILKDAIEMIPY